MKAIKITILILLLILIMLVGLLIWQHYNNRNILVEMTETTNATPTPAPPSIFPLSPPKLSGLGGPQQALEQAYCAVWAAEPLEELQSDGLHVLQPLRLTVLDAEALAGAGAREELIRRLEERVGQASRRSEIFDEEGAYLPELLRDCYRELLEERLQHPEDYRSIWRAELFYTYADENWELQNGQDLYPALPDAEALYAEATAELPILQLHYSIPEDALCGYVPDEEKFLVTEDPMEVAALLERTEAKALIGDQRLLWNPDLPFVSGSKIRCYLDESILCILWQEPENGCMGTFAEIIIADGSQLRRKISSDEPWSLWFERTSEFALKANAVLAVGGDFYYHDRSCGVAVYQRQMIRFRPDNADTCFITAGGDMLFLYRGTGINEAEMQQYLVDNDVVFSLAFGPVLIDNGVDVTPEHYPWGEIDDFYARSALGMLGERHYLTMNLNCYYLIPELDHLPNLRDAADAMVKRGCWKAYTLDGGRTATTAFHFQLVNPVQYGKEIPISDIIYFATAVPME